MFISICLFNITLHHHYISSMSNEIDIKYFLDQKIGYQYNIHNFAIFVADEGF